MKNRDKLEKELDTMFSLIDNIICRENAERAIINEGNEGGEYNGSNGDNGGHQKDSVATE